jgi:putative transposase
MARLPRLFVPGWPCHIIQRGNNRQVIFEDDQDRWEFRRHLQEIAREHGWAIHAYVLMSNHVHLLVTPEKAESVPRGLQALGRRYVAYFNRRYQRTGTLWEGRYKANLLEADSQLLLCQRYVELNPVRGGLALNLLDFAWSSLLHHVGEIVDPLVTDHACFWKLGNTPFERQAAYRSFLEAGISEDEVLKVTQALNSEHVLGSARAIAELEVVVGRNLGRRPRGRPPKQR